MPYTKMTTPQAAEYLHLSEKEVERLAGHGVLPGRRAQDRWVFVKQDLDDWLAAHMHRLAEEHLHRIRSGGQAPAVEPRELLLAGDLLRVETIELNVSARTASSAIRGLCKVAEKTWLVYDPPAVVEAVREREAMCSTACPGGFALPHPRARMPHLLAESLVVFGRTPQGISFGAPQGQPTDLFFLVLAADDPTHLQLLARLSLLLREDDTRDALREVAAPEDALDLLARQEAKLTAPPSKRKRR